MSFAWAVPFDRQRAARVLVEKPGFGRSEHYAAVELTSGAPGEILPLHIFGTARGRLQGRLAA